MSRNVFKRFIWLTIISNSGWLPLYIYDKQTVLLGFPCHSVALYCHIWGFPMQSFGGLLQI